MDKQDVIDAVETACEEAISMSMSSALQDESGCGLGRNKGWMSPKRFANALLSFANEVSEEQILPSDFEEDVDG